MKTIELTRGLVALVDDADYESLNKFKWYAHRDRKTFYARRNASCKKNGTQRGILMHSQIIGLGADHKNRFGLDNRRANLRQASASQQASNVGLRRDNFSGFKGVVWKKESRKWQAQLQTSNKRIFLGYFYDAEAAARAYDAAAIKHHGEFAFLNFPVTKPV